MRKAQASKNGSNTPYMDLVNSTMQQLIVTLIFYLVSDRIARARYHIAYASLPSLPFIAPLHGTALAIPVSPPRCLRLP